MRFFIAVLVLCFSTTGTALTSNYSLNLANSAISGNAEYSELLAKNSKKKKKRKKKKQSRQREQVTEEEVESAEGEEVSDQGDRPTMSIEANPLGLIFGALNAEINFKLSDKMTVGPMGSFFSAGGLTGYGVGGTGYYYFNQLFEGLFFNASGNYSFVSFNFLGYSLEASGIGVAGIVGYKWLWSSFLIGLGGGVQFYSFSISSSYEESDTTPSVPMNGVGLALLFNIGIPF